MCSTSYQEQCETENVEECWEETETECFHEQDCSEQEVHTYSSDTSRHKRSTLEDFDEDEDLEAELKSALEEISASELLQMSRDILDEEDLEDVAEIVADEDTDINSRSKRGLLLKKHLFNKHLLKKIFKKKNKLPGPGILPIIPILKKLPGPVVAAPLVLKKKALAPLAAAPLVKAGFGIKKKAGLGAAGVGLKKAGLGAAGVGLKKAGAAGIGIKKKAGLAVGLKKGAGLGAKKTGSSSGATISSGHDSGHASPQVCRTVEKCWDKPVRKCKSVPIQTCEEHPIENCHDEPRQKCWNEPETKCTSIPEEKCWQVNNCFLDFAK